MSFWTAEDKIPVSQTKVSIPAEHGLEYSAGQKCVFNIPAGIGFFQPKESYLNLTVKIAGSTVGDPTRLQLDAETGAQILIRDVRVYSGGAGRILLEEFQNYNVLTALKYDYETNDTLKAKRGLTEGATVYSEKGRSDHGNSKSQQNNLRENPYFQTTDTSASYSTAFTDAEFESVKCLLPLNTGIFQNEKIFPIAMTEGLIVEIIFEDNARVFRTLDQTNRFRRLAMNPFFNFFTGDNKTPDAPGTGTDFGGSLAGAFYIRRDNCQGWGGNAAAFPFVVGEEVRFINASTGVDNPSTGAGTSIVAPKIARIEYVGGTTNAVKVQLSGSYRGTHIVGQHNCLYSRAVVGAASYSATYTISNAHFVVQQVSMPEGYTSKLANMMKSGGTMNYDFLSSTNYKISQLQSERVANLRLPLNQSRAKSILCIPTDATVVTQQEALSAEATVITDYELNVTDAWHANHTQRSGFIGCSDHLTSYQLFYDGKLNPNRKVVCAKTSGKVSVDAQPLIELEKALVMSGIKPFSLMNFRNNFCIGRALSLQDGTYDTRGKDFNLQLDYQETTAPAINKLWMCWCAHLRRIAISGNGIALQI